jgi:hypothetical protein
MENFNIFRNLGMNENQHSNLLKKLLCPTGKHNQANLFLKSFVEDVLKAPYEDNLQVKREERAGKKGFVDLMICSSSCKYIIENKVNNAKDRDSQLYRYWRNHIYKKQGKLFYLTADGHKPANKSLQRPTVSKSTTKYNNLPEKLPVEVFTVSYKTDIKRWLEKCLKGIEKTQDNNRLICVLEQYIEWIEKYLT